MEQQVNAVSLKKSASNEVDLASPKSNGKESNGLEGFFANLLAQFQARTETAQQVNGDVAPNPPPGSGSTQSADTLSTEAALLTISDDSAKVTETLGKEGTKIPVAPDKGQSVNVSPKANSPNNLVSVLETKAVLMEKEITEQLQVDKLIPILKGNQQTQEATQTPVIVAAGTRQAAAAVLPAQVVTDKPEIAAKDKPSLSIVNTLRSQQAILSAAGITQDDLAIKPDTVPIPKIEPGWQSVPGMVAKMDGPFAGEIAGGSQTQSTLMSDDGLPMRSIPDFSIKSIKYMMENNVEMVRLKLSPQSLGDIQISVVKTGDISKVIISSANPIVREFLESHMSGLRDNLNQEGVQVNHVSVQAKPVSIGEHTSRGDLQQQASGNQRDSRSQYNEKESQNLSREHPFSSSQRHDGILNMYV